MEKIEIIKADNQRLIEEISGLAQEIWTEHYTPIIGAAQVEYMLNKFQSVPAIKQDIENGCLYYLLSETGRETFGYLSIRFDGSGLILNRIYIKTIYRRKGFARQAINFVEHLAKDKRCQEIILTVNKNNTHSIKAYEILGFKNAGPVVKDIGNGFVMDDYKMVKILVH